MALLALSLAALLLGPLSERIVNRAAWIESALDGFVLTALVGLIAIHILPHSLEVAGLWSLVAAAIGLLVPLLLEHRLHQGGDQLHRWLLVAGFLGYAVHATLDGIALATGHDHHDPDSTLLGIAVVLHRVPVGLAIWWLLRPAIGRVGTSVMIGLIAGTTILGFVASDLLLAQLERPGVAMLQALVAGSLLHVTLHPASARGPKTKGAALASGVGALVALALLVGLATTHPMLKRYADEVGAGRTFAVLYFEIAPAVLLGLAVLAFAPKRWGALQSTPGPGPDPDTRIVGRLARALSGVWLGVTLPRANCGAPAEYRTLASGPTRAAFLSASGLSVICLAVSALLLGFELTLFRTLVGLALAAAVGMLFGGPAPSNVSPRPASTRWEGVDHSGPALLLGLGAAALVEPMIDRGSLAQLPTLVVVPMAALVGAIVPFNTLTAIPVLAILVHKGLPPGAALSTLVALPLVGRDARRALAQSSTRGHGLGVSALALLAAIGVGLLPISISAAPRIDLHQAASSMPNWPSAIAGIVLGGLLASSLLRQGLRGFVAHLLGHEAPTHEHHHHGDHAEHHHHRPNPNAPVTPHSHDHFHIAR